ncbi:MAG: dihydroorotate dehydrogenase-like protein [Sphingobacteriales bacterium]|nr:dihydroorotate dehydrogenase-like protein [Sphingobacteriales bacterium]
MDLTTSFAGFKLKNPIIAGSSGMTDSVEKIISLENAGASAVIVKSLFEEEIIYEMEEQKHSMSGRFFVYPEKFDYMEEEPEEDSVRKYLRLLKEAKESVSIPVLASINCVSSQKWTYFASEIEKTGVDALELNAFILPSDFHRTGAENEKLYFEIIQEVKKHTNLPLILKISFYFSNLAQMIVKLSETGIKGITLFNRFYSPDFDIDNLSIIPSYVLSTPEDLPISLRWIGIMSGRVKCDLAASTGVHDGKALIKQLLAGANAVQLASTLYHHGPEYISVMLGELKQWMEYHEFNSIDDFRGKLSFSKAHDPAAYERVQFMKNFRKFRR